MTQQPQPHACIHCHPMPSEAERAIPARELEIGALMQPCLNGCRKRSQPTFRIPLVGTVLIMWHRLACESTEWAALYATNSRSTSTTARRRFPSSAGLHLRHIAKLLQATFYTEVEALSRLSLRGLRPRFQAADSEVGCG
jgi:heme/copper-type cytochrome/quinol oxidase subunit 3